ncbi:ribosome biogenesis regulatory protein homolog, partial [Ixodes scapularis]
PYVDYVGELKEKKKERVAKNEYQRLRNIARNSKAKVPKNLFPPTENLSKDQVATAVTLAKSSTASHGKFAGTLKEEKNVRVRKAKRKFESNMGSLKKEKASQLKVLDEMARKKPKLDINQAVNHFIHDEEVKASRNKDKKTPKKLKGKQQSSKRKGGNNKARGKGRAGGKQKGGNKRNRK